MDAEKQPWTDLEGSIALPWSAGAGRWRRQSAPPDGAARRNGSATRSSTSGGSTTWAAPDAWPVRRRVAPTPTLRRRSRRPLATTCCPTKTLTALSNWCRHRIPASGWRNELYFHLLTHMRHCYDQTGLKIWNPFIQELFFKEKRVDSHVCSFLNGSLHDSLNCSNPSYCKNQNPSSAPPGWTGLNFSLSLNMYQIMLKRTSITYPICSFLNGSLYGSLHAQKQRISSLVHPYCTIDSYLGMY